MQNEIFEAKNDAKLLKEAKTVMLKSLFYKKNDAESQKWSLKVTHIY